MNTRPARTALAAVAALALLAAACGGDDDEGAADTTAAAGAVTTAGAADTTAAAATTAAETTAAAPTTAAGTEPAGTEPAGTEAGGSAPAGGEVTVAVAETELGPILVDGEGLTLYGFLPDNQGPSTCEEDCLAAWPALLGTATAGEGVDDSLLGTATRPDGGGEQVTYDGWPLYYYAQDQAPGDVNGQGVGDIWYVMTADGEFVSGSDSGPTTTG